MAGARRRPFGDRLEIEREDAGVLGKVGVVERVRSPQLDVEDVGMCAARAVASAVDVELRKRSARTRQWLALGGGAFAATFAWALRLSVGVTASGSIELLTLGCAVLGPAAFLYALAQFVWPEPPPLPARSQFGSSMVDAAAHQRLWGIRVLACAFGVIHLVVLWALA